MRNITVALPSFAFVIVTRAALAAGIGLLAADRVPAFRRRRIGAALVAVGVATTIPALFIARRGVKRAAAARRGIGADPRLIGATRFPRKGDDIL